MANTVLSVSGSVTPRIPWRRKASMVLGYARGKVAAQVRAVAFITVYLAVFQVAVLRAPIAELPGIILGIVAVVVGLAFFMEGLFLGIMPLGEACGLRLPARVSLGVLVVFALVLGGTATYAEPAIAMLRVQGGATLPWRAPLLFFLLNSGAHLTVAAVALGVGVAVLIGVFRFLRGWSLKPFLFSVIPALLGVSWLAARDPRTAAIIGLAWDSGGITTGPVTVPLVIALGVGVSRIAGRGHDASGGLGVVTFASALPIMAVLILGLTLAPRFPKAVEADVFFAPENRVAARTVLGADADVRRYAAKALNTQEFADAFDAHGPEIADASLKKPWPADDSKLWMVRAAVNALKAILPLTFVLLVALWWLARARLSRPDEISLGLVFSLLGMFLFGLGMESGLARLGRQTGSSLSRAWEATERYDQAVTFENISESTILRAARPDGSQVEYLAVEGAHAPVLLPFERSRFDADSGRYLMVPRDRPVAAGGVGWGYALVLAFVFAMGLGATIAEPSLNALGVTLEELTTGTYKCTFLVGTVAIGVGMGMTLGFSRILFNWPLLPLLAGAYTLALFLTIFSSSEITAIAWDSGGVTTGPITVPLVIAAGLGIGKQAGAVDAFGILAFASVFPVITVLLSGFVLDWRQGSLSAEAGTNPDEALNLGALR